MADPVGPLGSPCFVEFVLDDEERFEALCAVYAALRHDKQAGAFRADEEWLALFDEHDLARFSWPTRDEREAHAARWWATPVPRPVVDPRLRPPSWTFKGLLGALQNIDVALLGCRRVPPDRGRLEFEPNGWPYGGTASLWVLAEAFGFRMVGQDDGFGYHTVDTRETRAWGE